MKKYSANLDKQIDYLNARRVGSLSIKLETTDGRFFWLNQKRLGCVFHLAKEEVHKKLFPFYEYLGYGNFLLKPVIPTSVFGGTQGRWSELESVKTLVNPKNFY